MTAQHQIDITEMNASIILCILLHEKSCVIQTYCRVFQYNCLVKNTKVSALSIAGKKLNIYTISIT